VKNKKVMIDCVLSRFQHDRHTIRSLEVSLELGTSILMSESGNDFLARRKQDVMKNYSFTTLQGRAVSVYWISMSPN
jgi:hypothetical protein